MDSVPFKPIDLVADEKYIAERVEMQDWFNLMLFVLGNAGRMATLRKLLKAKNSLPVPPEQITPFLATVGLDLRVMKAVFSPGWFLAMSADTLANLYTFNEWVAERLDTHICEHSLHCVLFHHFQTDIRAVRHYLQVRSHHPIIDRACDLCCKVEERAIKVLSDLDQTMFDRFTVQEMRAIKYLLLGRPNQAVAEKLLRIVQDIIQ